LPQRDKGYNSNQKQGGELNKFTLPQQPQDSTTGRLLTAEQVAEIICCSPKTVYSWAELGHIPSIKIGVGRKALLRFDSEEIYAWLQFWKEETAKRYNLGAGIVAGARKGGR
jgi:excisionase family DNA binding protein